LAIIEVPGIGPVQADGFAEEQTLQRVLAAIQLQTESQKTVQSGGIASLNAISARAAQNIKDLAEESRAGSGAVEQASQSIKDSQTAVAKANRRYSSYVDSQQKFLNSAAKGPLDLLETAGSSIKGTIDNVLDGVIKSGGGFSSILAGASKAVLGFTAILAGAIPGDLNKMAKSYYEVQSAGGLFAGSMLDFRAVALASGLTMEQFGNVIKKNAEDVSKFGGQSLAGAQAFVRQNADLIRNQGQELLRLGLSFEDMGSRTAEFMAMINESGQSLDQLGYDTASVSLATKQLVINQKALAAINGTTLEQEREKMRQQRKDAQLNAVMMGLTAQQRQGIQELSATFPQATQFIKEFVAFGGPVSKEALMQQSMMGATTDAIANTLNRIEAGADPTAAINALKEMSASSGAIAGETAAMADLVKLGVAGSTNSFVQMAERNFQQQFELSNKLTAGVVDMTINELNESLTGFRHEADQFTSALTSMSTSAQAFTVALGSAALAAYQTTVGDEMIALADNAMAALSGVVMDAAKALDKATSDRVALGTESFRKKVPGMPEEANTAPFEAFDLKPTDSALLDKFKIGNFGDIFSTAIQANTTATNTSTVATNNNSKQAQMVSESINNLNQQIEALANKIGTDSSTAANAAGISPNLLGAAGALPGDTNASSPQPSASTIGDQSSAIIPELQRMNKKLDSVIRNTANTATNTA